MTMPHDPDTKAKAARWREDFPTEWEQDAYVARREFAKFLVLGSALLAGANGIIAAVGRRFRKRAPRLPRLRIAGASVLPPGGSLLFRYPTEEDPCILIRTVGGELKAYSQMCTHLSCAVVYRAPAGEFHCPCHDGRFSAGEGRPIAGPPTRRLPKILIEQEGSDIYAIGKEP
ncbi:MAG: Rieske 2Fe-2S domain-containing protein [Planctomycetes bacterium]|nr:Rieske 2Fe-2S domain-containing protein [Planctomycetota bacterium]